MCIGGRDIGNEIFSFSSKTINSLVSLILPIILRIFNETHYLHVFFIFGGSVCGGLAGPRSFNYKSSRKFTLARVFKNDFPGVQQSDFSNR